MLSFFPKKTVDIPGFLSEQWSITRVGRSKTSGTINNQFQALVPKNTNAAMGTPITSDGEVYFVTTLEKSFVNTVCQLRKTNAIIDIVRITQHFTGTKQDYDYEVPLYSSVIAFCEDITGKMQQYDASLVAKATRRILVPELDLKLMDRIKINGHNAQIEAINASSYPGLLSVQTSNDIRVTKVTL